ANPGSCSVLWLKREKPREENAPARIRTWDPLLRRQLLYPLSYGSKYGYFDLHFVPAPKALPMG
ncbi:MAG: hypothetical protein K0Q72_4284, partial [Armatimonadetes bacterium]|nr:hypothetical protein [Armatimonadota bacterium]